MDIQEKLSHMKEKYRDPIDAEQISAWENEVQNLMLVQSALENEGVKRLIAELDTEVRKIEDQLMTSDSVTLPDRERDRAIDRKRIYERVIAYFDVSRLGNLENEIDKNL